MEKSFGLLPLDKGSPPEQNGQGLDHKRRPRV